MPIDPGMPPPLPPGIASAGPSGNPPSMTMLAGLGGAPPTQTTGMSQISGAAVRMAAQIDQALKLLAQAIPQLSPWVEKTAMELRFQIGTALQSGAVPTSPVPQDNESMPDGSGRI